MPEVFLITGGTGKTGSRLASQLRFGGRLARVASRQPGHADVRFEWQDPSTFQEALTDVRGMYVVAPTGASDPLPVMLGQVHRYLKEHAREWVVLRPSWFMQIFLNNNMHKRFVLKVRFIRLPLRAAFRS